MHEENIKKKDTLINTMISII